MQCEFDKWFDTYDRDGGELMLYNTIDLQAAFEAGAKSIKGVEIKGNVCMQEHGASIPGLSDVLLSYPNKVKVFIVMDDSSDLDVGIQAKCTKNYQNTSNGVGGSKV